MEYEICNIRKVKHIREDKTKLDGYAFYFMKDGVCKMDVFSKDVKMFVADAR